MTKLSLLFLVTLMNEKFSPKDPTPTPKLKHHWAYDGEDGPSTWPLHYEICGRNRQSPIDIVGSKVEYNPNLPEFKLFNFDVFSQLTGNTVLNITNNGHSASCAIKGDYYVDGGGLGGHYRTAEFHFHWGGHNSRGSEHAMSGKKYPMEMHIVNYAEKYGNLSTAMKEPDGLAVLGVFFELSDHDNPALQPIMSALQNIVHNGDYNVIDNCSVRALVPSDLGSYYRYEGSLTTPPCYESVIWTVFAETQHISERQLEILRSLEQHQHDTHGPQGHTTKGRKRMMDNFRPLQNLNRRRVHKSFNGQYTPQQRNQFSSPPTAGSRFPSPSNMVGHNNGFQNGGAGGSGMKNTDAIFSSIQDTQKHQMMISEANKHGGTDPKAASHQTHQTMNEQNTNVKLPSANQMGGARGIVTTPRPANHPYVTLVSGQFLPSLLPGEKPPTQSSSSSSKLQSMTLQDTPPNPFTNPKPVITSGAMEKPTSTQSISQTKLQSPGGSINVYAPPSNIQPPQTLQQQQPLQQQQQQAIQWSNTGPRYQTYNQPSAQSHQAGYHQYARTYNFPQPAPPVYLQPSPQPVRVRNPYFYNYYINRNTPEVSSYNYQSNNFTPLNFGALGELKKRKRRTSHKRKSRSSRHHVHDENCKH